MNKQPKIEGYWYSKHTPEYPMPVPNVLSQKQAQTIHALIEEKQKIAENVAYKGFSSSRITGEILGSTEYHTDEWIWPDSLSTHYVLEYRVKPSIDFLKYIGYIDDLLNYKELYEDMSKRLSAIRKTCGRVYRHDLIVNVSEREQQLAKLVIKQCMGHKLDILDE